VFKFKIEILSSTNISSCDRIRQWFNLFDLFPAIKNLLLLLLLLLLLTFLLLLLLLFPLSQYRQSQNSGVLW